MIVDEATFGEVDETIGMEIRIPIVQECQVRHVETTANKKQQEMERERKRGREGKREERREESRREGGKEGGKGGVGER